MYLYMFEKGPFDTIKYVFSYKKKHYIDSRSKNKEFMKKPKVMELPREAKKKYTPVAKKGGKSQGSSRKVSKRSRSKEKKSKSKKSRKAFKRSMKRSRSKGNKSRRRKVW